MPSSRLGIAVAALALLIFCAYRACVLTDEAPGADQLEARLCSRWEFSSTVGSTTEARCASWDTVSLEYDFMVQQEDVDTAQDLADLADALVDVTDGELELPDLQSLETSLGRWLSPDGNVLSGRPQTELADWRRAITSVIDAPNSSVLDGAMHIELNSVRSVLRRLLASL